MLVAENLSKTYRRHAVAVRVQIADPRLLYLIIERIRNMFDLNADWATIAETLGTDPALTSRINAQPGLRVPGCWNGFELTIEAILGQNMPLKRATALIGRIAATYGERISGVDDLTHIFPSHLSFRFRNVICLGALLSAFGFRYHVVSLTS